MLKPDLPNCMDWATVGEWVLILVLWWLLWRCILIVSVLVGLSDCGGGEVRALVVR